MAWWGLGLACLALTSGACVIPLPYEDPVPDGGANYPPLIVASTVKIPGPLLLTLGPDGRPSLDSISITVQDRDVEDTIYARVFRDYNFDQPTPPYVSTEKASTPGSTSIARTLSLPTNTWCNTAMQDVPLVFDVVVADRKFDENPTVKPAYRAVTAGGEFSVGSWVVTCHSAGGN
ncbi:MAG: hypothetical protein HY698_01750 [Deltaproteobacteria bacterium]|nr:hypothetical protein [Deltaproteobacteria bacterium]